MPNDPQKADDYERHPHRVAGDDYPQIEELEAELLANFIADVHDSPRDELDRPRRGRSKTFCDKFPVYEMSRWSEGEMWRL